jgi:hypothetical protein
MRPCPRPRGVAVDFGRVPLSIGGNVPIDDADLGACGSQRVMEGRRRNRISTVRTDSNSLPPARPGVFVCGHEPALTPFARSSRGCPLLATRLCAGRASPVWGSVRTGRRTTRWIGRPGSHSGDGGIRLAVADDLAKPQKTAFWKYVHIGLLPS